MERTVVQSSNLVSVGYDAETETLEVEFRGKRVYQYKSVPWQVHRALMTAPSAGQYFDTQIRRAFDYEYIETPDAETH